MDLLTRVQTLLAGRYDVEREIGHGGMSVVYVARDLKHERPVAVKVLRPELTASIGAERFAREIHLTACLEHIHVLPLFDSGSVDGLAYYVMPYVEGGSLRDLLRREGALGLDDVVRITGEIADGLAHAHEDGIVHRDVKPENVLFIGGHAVVADFGIAHAFHRAGDEDSETLTEYGLAIGTPAYMSPEQAAGERTIDHRSDVYALGCVVYEMLAGAPPFEGPTMQSVLAKHIGERVPSLAVVRPDIPQGMVDAVEQSLSKVAGDRFQTVGAFALALRDGRYAAGAGPGRVTASAAWVRAHPAASAVLALVALGAYPAVRLLNGGPGPAFADRPESVVVLPYHTAMSDDRERELTVELAGLLTRELNGWETIRAVPSVALSGPMFDMGVEGPTLGSAETGVELGRRLGVQAMIAVSVNLEADSVQAEATLYDVGTRRSVGRPFLRGGPAGDPIAIAGPLALDVLGLGALPMDPARLRRGTANPDALLDDYQGAERLARWRLAVAEQSFRAAIAGDSTFALALHHLAQTLYWQGRESEVTQWSARAVRHAAGLPSRDSLHIQAFHEFLVGAAYDRARSLYRELLTTDSTDVYAWLMLGAVEWKDPWLIQLPTGELVPRSNLNVAIAAFTRAVQLQPRFDLGYGHLGDIYDEVVGVLHGRGCRGFERPRSETRLPWEVETPHQMVSFCPIVLDSIVWMEYEDFRGFDRSVAIEGAERRMQEWARVVRRWTDYAPREPKPREEAARVAVKRLEWLGIAPPETIDSMTRLAIRHTLGALALKGDTAPGDLLLLGNLHLELGQLDTAVALTERALLLYGDAPVPAQAANAFLAAGQPSRALPIVTALNVAVYLPDPATSLPVPYGGARAVVDRIRVLGATGVSGEPLQRELRDLERTWAGPTYTPRIRDVLRRQVQPDLRVAMLFDQAAIVSWSEGLVTDDPLWEVLIVSDAQPSRARILVDRALELSVGVPPSGLERMLLGVAAQRAGNHCVAASLFSALDSIPASVTSLDFRWGLRSLSLLLRAEAHAACGHSATSRRDFDRFIDWWSSSDSLTRPLVARARRALGR